MLYREIIAVCSQIHTKHINTPCGQNVELLNVEPGGTNSDHRYLKYKMSHSRQCIPRIYNLLSDSQLRPHMTLL